VILGLIDAAQRAGARLSSACRVLGLSTRTIERWRARPDGDDGRVGPHHAPPNALTDAERARLVGVMTSVQYAGLSPKQLVPRLADQGVYLASESTLYRLRRRFGLTQRRPTVAKTHVTRAHRVHRATGPNQVWSWDITYLPTTIRGQYLYLYLVVDVWSRRVVGWSVQQTESANHAAELISGICDESGINPKGLVLHSDNGSPMRGSTMVATLQWLGIVPSFSRPHVCNDNPYSEALFRTLKHTPTYPRLPFASVETARAWVAHFVDWYNREHLHSGIRYVTPDERHFGRESDVLARRSAVYERARRRTPERWSRSTRNWTPIGLVVLNPEPDVVARRAA
jgi:transposase InsO family protein